MNKGLQVTSTWCIIKLNNDWRVIMGFSGFSIRKVIDYITDIKNMDQVHLILKDMTHDEMVLFTLSQKGLAGEYVRSHIDAAYSLFKKISAVDDTIVTPHLNLKSPYDLDEFEERYAEAVKIKPPIRRIELFSHIHEFEKRNGMLMSEMSPDAIKAFGAEENMVSALNVKRALLDPIREYIDELIFRGLAVDIRNPAKEITYLSIDLTDSMWRNSVGDKNELMNIINTVFDPVEHNVGTNRYIMAILLVYAGVEVKNLLSLKESDVVDGVLRYQGKEIVLDEMCLKISEIWKQGFYYPRKTSVNLFSLIDDDSLIKTHEPLKANTLSKGITRSLQGFPVKQISLSDIYRSGCFMRYQMSGELPSGTSYQRIFQNDVYFWQKAFLYI